MTKNTEATATVKTSTAKKYTVKDLSQKLNITDSKKTRALLRSIAKTDESPRFRIAGKSYEWNGNDFRVVVRRAERLLEAAAEVCSADCMSSISERCECHCNGANHGAHSS